MTMTLPLAPPEYFVEGYKIIEEQADSMRECPDIHLFLAYFRRNWLPAASKVSVYKCPARTNNIVESFHNMATKKFGTKHPNLWIFLGNYFLSLFIAFIYCLICYFIKSYAILFYFFFLFHPL